MYVLLTSNDRETETWFTKIKIKRVPSVPERRKYINLADISSPFMTRQFLHAKIRAHAPIQMAVPKARRNVLDLEVRLQPVRNPVPSTV